LFHIIRNFKSIYTSNYQAILSAPIVDQFCFIAGLKEILTACRQLLDMRLKNPPRPLPAPDEADVLRVKPLVEYLAREIRSSGGKIPFSRFMELALYTPELGYYLSSHAIFGTQGDFITAPEMTPIFSRCIARQIENILNNLNGGDILEFGAGVGTMACDILMELETLSSLPENYYISEISPRLRERQKTRISTYAPHLLERVSWIQDLPSDFKGIILGNEILDAIPPHRVRLNESGNHQELFVTYNNGEFEWLADECSTQEIQDAATAIYKKYGEHITTPYDTEINFQSLDWIENIANCLSEGLILLIDYGFNENEFYRAERKDGSLMCHYKHCAHNDPLTHIGLQDITSHVNFTAIAERAFDSGLTVSGYTSQSYFLISCGLDELLSEIDINDTKLFIQETQPIKALILPDEMGELFKVIGLTKNIDFPLLGFSTKNQLERL